MPPAGRRAPWQRAPAICVAPVTLDPVVFLWFGWVWFLTMFFGVPAVPRRRGVSLREVR